MHELGVVIEVVKTVERVVAEQELSEVEKIVLQIGELSSMIPKYIESCFPAAVDGTILENTELEIEVIPANAMCNDCNKVFNVIENKNECPYCKGKSLQLLTGREFNIKEILAC